MSRHPAARPIALLPATMAIGATLACRTPSSPPDATTSGTLSFTAPTSAPSDWLVASSTAYWRAGCQYQVQPVVQGAPEVTLLAARIELTSTEIAPVPYRLMRSVAPESLATLFRTTTLVPKQIGSILQTSVEFARGLDPRGAVAAHDARWVFIYRANKSTDSATFTVRCKPITTFKDVSVFYQNFTHPLAGAQVTIGTVGAQTGTTSSSGQARFDAVVVGRQRVSIQLAGYAPLDTVLDIDSGSILEFGLAPLAGTVPPALRARSDAK